MAPLPELPRRPARFGAAALLAAALCGIAGLLTASCGGAPRDDSAEAGFRDKSRDEDLRTLAYDIIVTQSTQRGVFMGWLQAWGLPQASMRPRMEWMPGHADLVQTPARGMALMHGMASEDALRRLRDAQGVEAEILFLQLMIRHHEGGVLMARALAGLSRRAEAVSAAKSIEDTQRAEIVQMTEMLAKRAAQPYESLLE
jgi:uncharacterized protein (DUF305 family)